MEKEVFDFNDQFVIRALNEENNDFIITLGNHLATPRHFVSYEEADAVARAVDWNLVASLAISLIEGMEKYKNNKKEEDK
nr:MAG TPA: UBA-like domain protein [Microviridae sp.]